MAEENAGGAGEILEGGPGLAYMPFVVMEDLLDKLKLLNYEEVSLENIVWTKHFVKTRICFTG